MQNLLLVELAASVSASEVVAHVHGVGLEDLDVATAHRLLVPLQRVLHRLYRVQLDKRFAGRLAVRVLDKVDALWDNWDAEEKVCDVLLDACPGKAAQPHDAANWDGGGDGDGDGRDARRHGGPVELRNDLWGCKDVGVVLQAGDNVCEDVAGFEADRFCGRRDRQEVDHVLAVRRRGRGRVAALKLCAEVEERAKMGREGDSLSRGLEQQQVAQVPRPVGEQAEGLVVDGKGRVQVGVKLGDGVLEGGREGDVGVEVFNLFR
jgi:hypothetical protein